MTESTEVTTSDKIIKGCKVAIWICLALFVAQCTFSSAKMHKMVTSDVNVDIEGLEELATQFRVEVEEGAGHEHVKITHVHPETGEETVIVNVKEGNVRVEGEDGDIVVLEDGQATVYGDGEQ